MTIMRTRTFTKRHQLWDFYLADEAGFAVHPFVCIAIIDKCKEDLEELEHLDLKT